jgi:phage anti-repressor protein
VSTVMVAPKDPINATRLIRYLLQSVKDGQKLPLSETQFQDGVRTAFNCLVSIGDSDIDSIEGNFGLELSDLLDNIPALTNIISNHLAGHIYYMAKQYGKAIHHWDDSMQRNTNEYFLAHAEVANDVNEKISWLDQAKATERIIQEYSLNDRKVLRESAKKICAHALETKRQYIEAIDLYREIGDTQSAIDLVKELIRDDKMTKDVDYITSLIRDIYEVLLSQNDFDLAHDLVRSSGKILDKSQLVDLAGLNIQALLQAGHWEEALRYVLPYQTEVRDVKRKSFPKVGRLKDIELLRLQGKFIREFAFNPPDTNIREKNILTDFFIEVQRPGYPYWGQEIGLRDFAIALERTGKNIDVLPFYERLLDQDLSPQDIRFVQRRWLKVKAKQIERAQKEDQSRHKRQYEVQFEEKLREWRFSGNVIASEPEYPKAIAYDEKGTMKIPNFEITWEPPSCLLKDKATDATVIIDVSNGSIAKFKIDFDVSKRDKIKEFRIAEWDLNGTILIGRRLKIRAEGNTQTFEIG